LPAVGCNSGLGVVTQHIRTRGVFNFQIMRDLIEAIVVLKLL
jgi:hypothetical protein